MATVQITVPDDLLPRVVAAVRADYPALAALPDLDVLAVAGCAILRDRLATYEQTIAHEAAAVTLVAAVTAAAAKAETDAAAIVPGVPA